MIGRLIFFDDVSDCDSKISMSTYYCDLPSYSTTFKNTIYLPDFEFQRSGFETNVFEEVDNLGVTRQIGRVSIERVSVDFIIHSNLLALYNSLPSYDYVYLEVFDNPPFAADTTLYALERVEFTDNTDPRQVLGSVTLTFDLKPEVKTACCTTDVNVLSDYLAYWDTNDSGTKNIDSEAEFQVSSLGGEYWIWQLYYEANGIDPLNEGDVKLEVIGVKANGDTINLGEFNGSYSGGTGDFFSDSSKWVTSYNMWDYFGASNYLGNGNIVRFAKKDFALENNFVGGDNIDNALNIEFYLSVNDSPQEKCFLPEVYSVLTSFGNQIGEVTPNYIQQYQIGLDGEPSTLTSYSETRTDLTDSSSTGINAFALDSIGSFSKTYDISPATTNESYSIISTSVASGLNCVQRKGTNVLNDLSIGADTSFAVSHLERPASYPVDDPTFYYFVSYEGTSGSFPISGAPSVSGVWYLDGVNKGFLNCSLGLHSQTVSSLTVTEDVRTVKFETSTSGGSGSSIEISIEFQYKLFRYY